MDTKLNGHKKGLKIPKGGNQKPYFKEGQTYNHQKERNKKDKQSTTKYYPKRLRCANSIKKWR